MQNAKCPTCGHETVPDTACPSCGHTSVNGTPRRPEPTPPPEVASWHIEHATPDVLAWATQTFDMEEFLAAKHEIEQGGGVQIDDLIAELERKIHGEE
jgi:hypothetical protein